MVHLHVCSLESYSEAKINMKTELKKRLQDFMEQEARSCSMEPGCITPEYVYRMWGGQVPLNEIEEALKSLEFRV